MQFLGHTQNIPFSGAGDLNTLKELFDPETGLHQVLTLRARVDLRVMAKKEYSSL